MSLLDLWCCGEMVSYDIEHTILWFRLAFTQRHARSFLPQCRPYDDRNFRYPRTTRTQATPLSQTLQPLLLGRRAHGNHT